MKPQLTTTMTYNIAVSKLQAILYISVCRKADCRKYDSLHTDSYYLQQDNSSSNYREERTMTNISQYLIT